MGWQQAVLHPDIAAINADMCQAEPYRGSRWAAAFHFGREGGSER